MKTVKLGRTDLEINPLGFGGIPIQRIGVDEAVEVVEYCIEKGINFIDTARLYGDSEDKIGKVLPKYRDKVIIATKAMSRDKEGMAKEIEESLNNLNIDCIDLYQCHNVRSLEQLDTILSDDGAYQALKEAKSIGKIKHIGITSHKTPVLLRALELDVFDTIQVPFNIIENEPAEELLPLCKENNIGVIVMKPVAGGALKDHVPASLKFILNHPVSVAIPGMESKEQIDENLTAITNPELTDKELEELQAEADSLGEEFCRKCDYCAPCPSGVDIPLMFIVDAYYSRYNMPEWATNRYRKMEINAGHCVECGRCEEKCPYELPIIDMLKEVHQHMGE